MYLFGWKQEGLGVLSKLFERGPQHRNPGARIGMNTNVQMQTGGMDENGLFAPRVWIRKASSGGQNLCSN